MDIILCPPDKLIVEQMDINLCLPDKLLLDLLVFQMDKRGPPEKLQFLTLALDAWILSKFSTLYWICLLLVFLILVGVELPLCL